MHQSIDVKGRRSYDSAASGAPALFEQRSHLALLREIATLIERRGFHSTHAKHLLYFLLMDSPAGQDFARRASSPGTCELVTAKWVEATLSAAVSGKRFVELGCRSGFTLRMLLDYGAQHAYGITSSEYSRTARSLLGADSVSVSHVTDMSLTLATYARLQRPDIVLNCGLLDTDRINAPANSRQLLLRALYQLNALNYVIGSVNGYQQSQLTLDHFPLTPELNGVGTRTCDAIDWRNQRSTLVASEFSMHLPPGARGMAPLLAHPHRRDARSYVVGFRFKLLPSVT
jgi:hypothetical protein